MPQASDAQRALMNKWFGSPIDDAKPANFLLARGWTLDNDHWWDKPSPSYSVSPYELECLRFLRDEWDHGFGRKHQGDAFFFTNVYADAGIPLDSTNFTGAFHGGD